MKISETKCADCPATIQDGPLYRANEKGTDPIWKCPEHIGDQADPEIVELCEAIHNYVPEGWHL